MANAPCRLMIGKRRRECGAVIVEFALVFMLFFMLMYGIVSYGVIFAIQHSLTHAANEGARAAVKDVGGLEARRKEAEDTVVEALKWLGTAAPAPEVTSPPCPGTSLYKCVNVKLTFNYAENPLIPPLPGLGVALPEKLVAQATVQLAAVY